jgi:serine/threonine protein kinase
MMRAGDQTTEIEPPVPVGTDESPVPVGAVLDGFRVERIISVREGLHTLAEASEPSGERVTLELLADPPEGKELRRRAAKLAKVQASIAHPHVLPLISDGTSGDRLRLSGAPADAVTLADRLSEGPLDVKEAVTLLSQVAGALETARVRGLVHRALAPAAIVVTTEDPPKALLTDFGIAVPDARGCELTGSVEDADYRSPEEIRGESPSPKSTVYSLACILVACLTGTPPYPYHRRLLALHAHLVEPPPRVSARNPELPGELDDVVARAMAKDPSKRYDSPAALMRAVQRALRLEAPIPGPSAPKRQQVSGDAKTASGRAQRLPVGGPGTVPAPAPDEAGAIEEPAKKTSDDGHAARSHTPKQARRTRRRTRRVRQGHPSGRSIARRLAPTWAGIALVVSALAGFAAGNGGSDDPKSPVEAASPPAEQAPRPAMDSTEPAVRPVVQQLEKRRAAGRRRLREARLPSGQAEVARDLAQAHRDARASLERAPGTDSQEARLAEHLLAVERAYRQLATAARRGPTAWQLASEEVLDRERDLELLLRTHRWT